MRFALSRRTAGLAFGQGEIALACFRHTPFTQRIDFLAKAPLPDLEESLTETARTLVSAAGCRGWPGAVALPAQSVLRQEIRMAASLTQTEREAELQDHLADYVPGAPPGRYCIDPIPISKGSLEDQILLAAAEESLVHRTVAIAENAGLVVRIVDIDEEAISRAMTQSPLSRLPCRHGVDRTLLAAPTVTLLVALGLGMRRCQIW